MQVRYANPNLHTLMCDEKTIHHWAFEYYARLRKIKAYVSDRYSEKICLADAACIVCMEPKSFSKFFRQKVGHPFHVWLSCIRICKAKQLMSRSEDSITEIAEQVGFSDLRSFERAFKTITGLTPVQFRSLLLDEFRRKTDTKRRDEM